MWSAPMVWVYGERTRGWVITSIHVGTVWSSNPIDTAEVRVPFCLSSINYTTVAPLGLSIRMGLRTTEKEKKTNRKKRTSESNTHGEYRQRYIFPVIIQRAHRFTHYAVTVRKNIDVGWYFAWDSRGAILIYLREYFSHFKFQDFEWQPCAEKDTRQELLNYNTIVYVYISEFLNRPETQ